MRRRLLPVLALLALLLVSGVLASLMVGEVHLSLGQIAESVVGGPGPASLREQTLAHTLIWELRLPRALLAAVVGMALALAGAVMQSLFRNPMADPYIVGVSAGAACGAVAAIVFKLPALAGAVSSVPPFAFLGALAATWLVYLLSRRGGRVPVATLLLTGIAVGALFTAATSFLVITRQESARVVLFWLMGSIAGAQWHQVASVAAYAALALVVVAFYARDMDVLLLGEERAQELGVNVERTRAVLLAASSLAAAAAVSVTGLIGFVGLVVPHLVRLVVGPRHTLVLPGSLLCGGALLVYADLLARSLTGSEIPIGVVTAFLGAPFFLYLLARQKPVTL